MLGNRRARQERKNTELPHQPGPPTIKQLQKMQDETLHGGSRVQLPFGEPPESFIITVSRDPIRGHANWMLYRGDGSNTSLEWEQATTDVNWVFNLIEAAFPMMTPKKVLAAEQEVTKQLPSQDEPAAETEPQKKEEEEDSSVKSKFEGDLENIAIPNLIQSIEMNSLTGRLELKQANHTALIFFNDGAPVHSTVGDLEGEDAILDLMGWKRGKFRFFTDDSRHKRTINMPLHHLLMAGAALQDQVVALQDKGIGLDTYLIRKHRSLTDEEFNKMVSEGTGCKEDLQKQFYELVDGRTPIVEILRQLPMKKTDWIPIVFNLVMCGLCSFKDSAEVGSTIGTIDWNEIHQVSKSLSRPDTNIFTYQSFLYFLTVEFYRYRRFSHPFSTSIISLGLDSGNPQPYAVPPQGLAQIGQHIKKIIRETDLVFHYGELGLACIHPCTDNNTVKLLATNLSEILNTKTVDVNGTSYPVIASIGTSSLPELCESLQDLVSLAQPKSVTSHDKS